MTVCASRQGSARQPSDGPVPANVVWSAELKVVRLLTLLLMLTAQAACSEPELAGSNTRLTPPELNPAEKRTSRVQQEQRTQQQEEITYPSEAAAARARYFGLDTQPAAAGEATDSSDVNPAQERLSSR